MTSECMVTAKSLDEALSQATEQLGVSIDKVDFEVKNPDELPIEVHVWVSDGKGDITDNADEDGEDNEITDEELDKIADTAIDFLRKILPYFGAQGAEIDEYEGDEGELILDIVGEDLAILIGRYGKTLAALQQLTTSVVNHELGYRYPVIIDVEGYRNRRRIKVESIAHHGAERAVKRHIDIKLHPMTAYERRIVHVTLRNNPHVETFSEGEGSIRHVVIHPL